MQYQRLAIACALAASLVLEGCSRGGGGAHGPQPLNVNTAQATRKDIATFVTLDGQIAPLEQSNLSFQQSAPILSMYANIGDVVSQGQLLASIDPSNLRAQLSAAQATASQAAASARGAQIGLPVAIMSNSSQLQTAKAALDNARLVYNQNLQLYKQGYVSQQQVANTRSQFVQAQSAYNTASASIQNNQVSAQNVKASQAQAQAAQAQAGVLSTQLAQTSLYAPFEGVITARQADPGTFAAPSSPVLSIARIDTVWVNVNVPDEDLTFVRVGTPVTFTTTSLPGRNFNGRVDSLNAVPTAGTLSYLARLRQPNPGALLRGGMLVSVTIPKARHNNAIVVPRSALAQTESGNSVFIAENGKATEVPVTVGLQTDTLTEVSSPKVTAGTQVITTRPDALQDGSPIAINGVTPPPSGSGAPPAPSAAPSGAPSGGRRAH
jgi:HlyD family secretion protein